MPDQGQREHPQQEKPFGSGSDNDTLPDFEQVQIPDVKEVLEELEQLSKDCGCFSV